MPTNVRTIDLPERLNGHRKGIKGVYVPGPEMIGKILESFKLAERKYVDQMGELQRIETAQKLQRAVLLAGPTGSGKSLLAKEFAGKKGMPFVHVTATEDTTDAKMRGYNSPQTFFIEIDGKTANVEANVFVPSPLSIAAMSSDMPVVLFIDELHKMRKGVASLLHALANKGERMLPMVDLTGEVYKLHPETILVCALNPDAEYGTGFQEIDPALRRRFSTIYLGLPETVELYTKIVDVNLEGMKGKGPAEFAKTKGMLIDAVIKLNFSMEAYKAAEETGSDPTTIGGADLGNCLVGIKERISPDSVIAALEFIWTGVHPRIAVVENVIHSVVEEFGPTVKALENYFQKKGVW